MQDPIAPITIALIGVTVYLSWRGFKNGAFFDKYSFRIDSILGRKEYYRVISSGFLHADLPHLIFNAFCFYSFGEGVELIFGKAALLSIYFLSLVGGGLLSLLIHRNHHDYTAVGASGAVSGIIFASIFLLPGGSVMLFLIPIPIPAAIFAILYTVISIYGIRTQKGNIGHGAHLGGAITGMLVTAALYPQAVKASPLLFAFIMVLTVGFLAFTFKTQLFGFSIGTSVSKHSFTRPGSIDHKQRAQMRSELDRLLQKVNEVGLGGLSRQEKKRLNFISKKLREDEK